MDFQLISWLTTRLRHVYSFLLSNLGLPVWFAALLTLAVGLLFFYCLYDIYRHRNKGTTTFIWLIILLVVPLSTFLYLLVGAKMVRNAPVSQPKKIAVRPTNRQNQPIKKKYFLGATTILGSIIATLALAAGCIVLIFFLLVIIVYVQCLNDPKCM